MEDEKYIFCDWCQKNIKDKNQNWNVHIKTKKHIYNGKVYKKRQEQAHENLIVIKRTIENAKKQKKDLLIITNEFNNMIIGPNNTPKDFYNNRNKELSDILPNYERQKKVVKLIKDNFGNGDGKYQVNGLGNTGWFSYSKEGYMTINEITPETLYVSYTGVYAISVVKVK